MQLLSTATPAQQIAAVREADVIFAGGQSWPAEVLAAAERCRLLVSCGAGVDRVDIAAASAARVMVCTMPDLCTDEVADHALALLLARVRQAPRLHARRWRAFGIGPCAVARRARWRWINRSAWQISG